jgi:hypothetical protein
MDKIPGGHEIIEEMVCEEYQTAFPNISSGLWENFP